MNTNDIKCGVCAVIRYENRYVREWVEYYYHELLFDKIILYDNNRPDEEKLSDVIGDYIDNGIVDIISIPTWTCFLVKAYNDCIVKYCNLLDWIAFFDLDEFLTLNENSTIKSYLAREELKDADSISFNWLIYDDNDLVYYEDKPVLDRFTRPGDRGWKFGYNFPENNHVKTMINCKLNNRIRFNGGHPHACTGTRNAVLEDGTKKRNSSSPFNHKPTYKLAYLKHFMMKTVDEYVRFKLLRGHPDVNRKMFDLRHNINKFFTLNKHTPEKDEYVDKLKKEGLIK